ncbi:MAG: 16S rRNA (uracil(1498)-N(3))-methyltransferase [Lentisphaerae bacterium]|jgi:16S rRNA (uracil1498-N3)-methyltransferase|nr:16S rRNA (uracil(1498)-N(3))-methyltransferase [Lentisphaerota bacterium]
MHRLLADSDVLRSGGSGLSDDAARHLKVVRPRNGEPVELFDGKGGTRRYRWSAEARSLVADGPFVQAEPPPVRLTLFACVTKGSRWDWTIEKATELGATKIVPVISERTIVRVEASEGEQKRQRWLRIAEEAARQSDAVWIPEVLAPVDFENALRLAAQTTCFAGALTDPPSEPLASAAERFMRDASEFSLFVGPEGDFTPGELKALLGVAKPTNFGPTILRAETAAMFGLSVLSAVAWRRHVEKNNERGK